MIGIGSGGRQREALRASFWPAFVDEVEKLANTLLKDRAQVHVREKDTMGAPGFEVWPRNQNAAAFSGYLEGDDLNLRIGRLARYEIYGFSRGGKVVSGMSWEDELRSICQTIIRGGFREYLAYDSAENVVSSRVKIVVHGREITFTYGGGLTCGLRKKKETSVAYEAYL